MSLFFAGDKPWEQFSLALLIESSCFFNGTISGEEKRWTTEVYAASVGPYIALS
jgi:hypothetical protein